MVAGASVGACAGTLVSVATVLAEHPAINAHDTKTFRTTTIVGQPATSDLP